MTNDHDRLAPATGIVIAAGAGLLMWVAIYAIVKLMLYLVGGAA